MASKEPVLKTGAEWDTLASETQVMDPDGWRNKGISFDETPITMEEYQRLKIPSTLRYIR